MKTYTEDQIRKAFFETYHETGDVFFPYPELKSKEACIRATENELKDFMDELNKL